jgi:hypothetical protein
MDPAVDGPEIKFWTAGNEASFRVWIYNTETKEPPQCGSVIVPDHIMDLHLDFLSIGFTPYLPAPANTYYIIIGAHDGSLITYDPYQNQIVETGPRNQLIEGQIGCLSIKNNCIVMASSEGNIIKYSIMGTQVMPDNIS